MAEGLEPRPGSDVLRVSDEGALDAPPAASLGAAARRSAAAPSPHSAKFRVATAMLVGIAVAAIIVAVALLATGRSSSSTSTAWSDWSPPDGGAVGAREIAEHIAPLYRVSSTSQLAVVTVVNVASASAAAAAAAGGSTPAGSGLQVAVQTSTSSSAVSLLSGTTIAYNLCGIGSSDCAIGVGTPSTSRLLLLRREALELALYTFKYLSGVENVVAILPPGHTEQTSTLTPKPPSSGAKSAIKPIDIAVLFVRAELKPFLDEPLAATLPEPFPPAVDQMSAAPEAGLVDQITARGLFSERIVQAQDGSSLLMLNPLPPQ